MRVLGPIVGDISTGRRQPQPESSSRLPAADHLRRYQVDDLTAHAGNEMAVGGPDSDIDILVDLDRPAGLLKLASLQNYLAAILECEVDVVPRDSVRPQLEGRINREALRVL